jgi:hypothetical protein
MIYYVLRRRGCLSRMWLLVEMAQAQGAYWGGEQSAWCA